MTGAVGVALAVVAAGIAVAAGGGEPAPVRPPEPMTVLEAGAGLGTVHGAAGDAWVDERWSRRLLRLDGHDGRVLARIPVDGRVSLSAGAGALWVLQSGGSYNRMMLGPLLRIDPATNEVTARIRLRTPADQRVYGLGVVAARDDVWVWGPAHVLRIDPRTNRVTQAITAPGEFTGLALSGGRPVVTTADGRLLRLGDEITAVPLPLADAAVRRSDGERLLVTAHGAVTAVEAGTGRLAWRKRLGFRVGAPVERDGLVWVHGSRFHDSGDRLWVLDAETGAVRGSTLLPAFSTTGMALVDGALWITSAGGRVIVVPSWVVRVSGLRF
jgi:PQQ-like domain